MIQHYELNAQTKIPYQDIMAPDGPIRIEYYHDIDVHRPSAFNFFQTRMGTFHNEYANWRTCVFESTMFAELAARKWHELILNPIPAGVNRFEKGSGVDARQWSFGSTDLLEEMLIRRFGSLPMNVITISHVEDKMNMLSGEVIRGPAAPGRLASKQMLGAAYQEVYHMYTVRDTNGKLSYQLQTHNRDGFAANTQLGADDPCYPHYESLWSNWKGARLPTKAFLYGDFGSGKSTFAATWPKPLLVWCFDNFGKEMPYLKLAT